MPPGPGYPTMTIRKARSTLIVAALFSAALALAGCGEEEGPAEETGENIDEAAEEVQEEAEEAGDAVEDATD